MSLIFQTICNRLGIDAGDRLSLDSKKRKFLVRCLPDELVRISTWESFTSCISRWGELFTFCLIELSSLNKYLMHNDPMMQIYL